MLSPNLDLLCDIPMGKTRLNQVHMITNSGKAEFAEVIERLDGGLLKRL